MKIDTRLLLPFIMPLVFLGFLRVMFWLAGSEWSQPGIAALSSFVFGGAIGIGLANVLFEYDIKLPSIRVGKARK